METLSCFFIFSLFHDVGASCSFFPQKQSKCCCEGVSTMGTLLSSLLWLSSPLPWAVWAIGSFCLKISHWSYYFCILHLLPLSFLLTQKCSMDFLGLLYLLQFIQALEKLGLAEEHTKLVLSSSTNIRAIDSVITDPGDDSKDISVQLPPHHFHEFSQPAPPDSFPAFSKDCRKFTCSLTCFWLWCQNTIL